MDTSWLPHDFQGYIGRGMRAVETGVSSLLSSAPQPASLSSALVATAPPVLLIAGKPEIKGDRTYRDASPSNVTLCELPDTPHIGGLSKHPIEWTIRVTGFLDQVLAVGCRREWNCRSNGTLLG